MWSAAKLELAAHSPVIEAICEKLFHLPAYCDDGALLAAIERVKLVSRDVDRGIHARIAANVGGDQARSRSVAEASTAAVRCNSFSMADAVTAVSLNNSSFLLRK